MLFSPTTASCASYPTGRTMSFLLNSR